MSNIKINVVNWYLDLTHLLLFPLNEFLCRRPSKRTNRWCIRYNIKYLQYKIGKLDLPITFFISVNVFWDMKITFLTLFFHFAETETYPLFADTELQSFGLLVSNRVAVICCQNVRQETTTKADLLYHRLVVKSSGWMNSFWKTMFPWCSRRAQSEICFSGEGMCGRTKILLSPQSTNENLGFNWEKEREQRIPTKIVREIKWLLYSSLRVSWWDFYQCCRHFMVFLDWNSQILTD